MCFRAYAPGVRGVRGVLDTYGVVTRVVYVWMSGGVANGVDVVVVVVVVVFAAVTSVAVVVIHVVGVVGYVIVGGVVTIVVSNAGVTYDVGGVVVAVIVAIVLGCYHCRRCCICVWCCRLYSYWCCC